MIKGVFFDLGGTLLSYRHMNSATMEVIVRAAEKMGSSLSIEKLKHNYNKATKDTTRLYSEKHFFLHKNFFNDIFSQFVENINVTQTKEVSEWFEKNHTEKIIDALSVKEDCVKVLKKLKNNGFYISVVSNIDENMLQPLIAKENINNYLDHALSSEIAKSCKPDKAIFQQALEISGLHANEILFVGDSPEHDIKGANEMGFRSALIRDGNLPPPLQTKKFKQTANYQINSLTELLEVLV